MSYTCPACLRTSHNPRDEREGYCFLCHAFMPGPSFRPTVFQSRVIKAMYHPDPEIAVSQLRRIVAQRRMELESFRIIHDEISMLLEARNLPPVNQRMLRHILRKIVAASPHTFDGLD